MEDFKLLNKSKMLLKYLEEYVLVNIPKVHSSYRVGLENNIIELNCNIIRANINTGSIRNKYQNEILVNIAMIDLYLDLLLDIKIISRKKFMVIIRMLNEIRKMANGWILSEKNK
ncbi:MAG: four helix bundle protein [Firmicutes bacterium]|nr:four helix bundle protein [Bacillota bacterium]